MSRCYLASIFIVGWILFFGQGLAFAQESLLLTKAEQEWISAHPQVSVVPDPLYHPVEFLDESGQYRGIAADYIAILEKKLGLHFQVLHPRDWEQVLEWARSRKADMITSAAQTPQRSEYMLFTKPYLEFPAVIIAKKQVTEGLTLKNLQGMKVGVISGDAVHEFIVRNHPDLVLAEVPDIPTGLKKLSFGMIDAFVGDLLTISYHIETEGIANLRVAGQSGFVYQLSFATRNDWPILHRILEKGLASIDRTEREAIYRKWVHLEPESLLATKKFWQVLLGIIATATLVIAVVIGWNRALKKQVARKTEELRASEEKYRSILENAVEGIFQTSPEGRFLNANAAMADLLGYDGPEALMSEPDLARHFYVNPRQRDNLWRCATTEGVAVDFEVELYRKDGGRIWVTSNVRSVRGADGKLLYIEGFVSDITERKRAEETLRESDRMKSEFIKTVAHEFRTPLTSIQGFSELLLTNDQLSPEEQREFLNYIHEKSVALADLVSYILDIARIEAGKGLSLNQSPCPVKEVFRQVEPFLKTQATQHRLEISLVEEDLLLRVDKGKIGQVLDNLLSNAVKFSPEGSSIQLRGEPIHDVYRVSVADQGGGMTPEQVEKIFDKFYRADASDTAVEGIGLGMSIVKHIVEAHGGEIWTESEFGRGTTVSFTLPLG